MSNGERVERPGDSGFLPTWRLKTEGVIAPDERLPAGQTILAGIQHVVAMFGSTAIAPILMGFAPNIAILFSGIGTLIFFLCVRGRVPSYLGSSFAFIAVVIAATGYGGSGPNANIPLALGGIIAAGALYTVIGLIVQAIGYGWVERLMPPVVTGAIVAAIGLNLAPVAVKAVSAAPLDTWIGLLTVLAVGLVAVRAPGMAGRLPVLLGGLAGYLAYYVATNLMGMGKPIGFSGVAAAAWFGMPAFTAPVFDASAMLLIAPVAVVLVAENLGHIKAIGVMTGRNLDPYIGRAFIGDGIATMLSASGGGTGVTTYAENMGVMAVTRIYSTLIFIVAAIVAILLGFSPKFGALILTIPGAVIGGLTIVVFGLISATAGRIWVQNNVDFSSSRNLITVGATLTVAAGDLTLRLGGLTLGGIGTATFGAILLYHVLGEGKSAKDAAL
ncbi:solute carrier family 23 protein [Cupriavidus plantarum]|uniref:solute carrier family 23 protein n=1 Tax=Cupriavidus plantarum TaxID=942865 RepID=UPI000E232696|nr:solute carrier family 23 protein [Cupriavidus plantarum]REF02674.1 uracil-xanthine permease [Cupriavidus plantarum]